MNFILTLSSFSDDYVVFFFVFYLFFFFFQAEDGIRDVAVTGVRRVLFRSSTLFPSKRTTSGNFKCVSLTASTMPAAITSHCMIPPKMFTRIPFTFGSLRIMRNARSEERREGKSVDLGGRRIIKKKRRETEK